LRCSICTVIGSGAMRLGFGGSFDSSPVTTQKRKRNGHRMWTMTPNGWNPQT